MSGGTIGGVIGAAVGFFLTGGLSAAVQWGFMIGSVAGAILFPPKGMDGPRLQDLRVQVSTYGKAIPRVWGTVRIAGNIFWSTDLKETAHEQGGKGVPSYTTYTYSASFAVAWCEGEVVGVRRKWANAQLKYDASVANAGPIADGTSWFGRLFNNILAASRLGFTFYPGSETQTPDPTIQADKGHTPAYLGTAYSVFEDLELEKFGNTLPSVEAEIVAHGTVQARPSGPIIEYGGPNGVNAICLDEDTGYLWTADQTTVRVHDPVTQTTIATIETGATDVINHITYCPATKEMWCATDDTTGNQCHVISATSYGVVTVIATGSYVPMLWNPLRLKMFAGSSSGVGTTNVAEYDVYTHALDGAYAYNMVVKQAVFVLSLAAIFGVTASEVVWLDAHAMNFYGRVNVPYTGTYGPSNRRITYDPVRSRIYTLYDEDTWTVNVIDFPTLAVSQQTLTNTVGVGAHGIYYHDATDQLIVSPGGVNKIALVDHQTFSFVRTFTTGGSNQNLDHGYIVPAQFREDLFYSHEVASVYAIYLGDALQPMPVPVSEIITDLSAAVGLTAADIDVTDIAGILCDGFVLMNRGAAQAGIEQLLMAYQIDVVESGGKVKYVRRAARSAVVIDPEEMGLHDVGQDAPTRLVLTRADEVDLPRSVTVTYMNRDADYQVGAQTATRQTTLSRNDVTHELAVVMTDAHAKAVAEAVLYATWAGRTTAKWSMSLAYAALEPTDLVSIDGNQIIISKATRRGNMIECEGVFHSGVVFTTGSAAGAAEPVQQTIPLRSSTAVEMMDIPLLRDQDDDAGFYIAAGGYPGMDWPGCVLFKSSDGGGTWDELATLTTAATMGAAVTALGDFSQNVFDEANTVTVRVRSGILASITRDAVLNGGNAALLGSEIIQFRTATLNADGSYTLSGLLRGRKGSPTSGHAIGERFVLLNTASVRRIDMATAEIGLERIYKAVTIGSSLAGARSIVFTNTAVGLECLSPVHLGGGRDASGNLTINWVRRTRIGGEWRNYVDAGLGEAAESYEVEVWNSTFTTLKRTFTSLSSPTTSYTSAQQVTDFGGNQSTVYVRVFQLSATVGRGFALQGSI